MEERRRVVRGLAVGAAVMLCCFVVANAYIIITLDGRVRFIEWPYFEEWWQAVVCLRAGAAAFWAFSRPLTYVKSARPAENAIETQKGPLPKPKGESREADEKHKMKKGTADGADTRG